MTQLDCEGKEGNRDGSDGSGFFVEDIALFFQVTRMRKIRKICKANLTSRLLRETG